MTNSAMTTGLEQLRQLTIDSREAVESADVERLLQLMADRQACMDRIDVLKAAGQTMTEENRQQLSQILEADNALSQKAEALLSQYREALRSVRNFRSVKAYMGGPESSSQYLDIRE